MAEKPLKPHASGQWTDARKHSFIKGGLRSLSVRWPPRYETQKEARIERGIYKCVGYKKRAHKVPASIPRTDGKKGRIKNTYIDHIDPVIDPLEGFVSWDRVIERLFCEKEGLQLLCKDCHDRKTKDERALKKKG